MEHVDYYIETAPKPWSGLRQLHAGGCMMMPAKDEVRFVGRFPRAMSAMMEARRAHRRVNGCPHCCKA